MKKVRRSFFCSSSVWLICLCLSCFCFLPINTYAASLDVSPVSLQLSTDNPLGVLSLKNTDDASVLIQIKQVKWSQKNGTDVYEKTDNLIVTPPVLSIPPKESKIVRIGSLAQINPGEEASYRLLLQEVPKRVLKKISGHGVRMVLHISLPVFIKPTNEIKKLSWRATTQNGQKTIVVNASNKGNVHVSVYKFKFYTSNQATPLLTKEVLTPILSHQTGKWVFDLPKPLVGQSVKMITTTDWGELIENLPLTSS